MAVVESEAIGFAEWFERITGMSADSMKPLKAVAQRGMAELSDFLRSKRVL